MSSSYLERAIFARNGSLVEKEKRVFGTTDDDIQRAIELKRKLVEIMAGSLTPEVEFRCIVDGYGNDFKICSNGSISEIYGAHWEPVKVKDYIKVASALLRDAGHCSTSSNE